MCVFINSTDSELWKLKLTLRFTASISSFLTKNKLMLDFILWSSSFSVCCSWCVLSLCCHCICLSSHCCSFSICRPVTSLHKIPPNLFPSHLKGQFVVNSSVLSQMAEWSCLTEELMEHDEVTPFVVWATPLWRVACWCESPNCTAWIVLLPLHR